MDFISFFLVCLSLSSGLLPSGLPNYTIYAFISLLVCHMLRLNLFDLIMRIMIGEG